MAFLFKIVGGQIQYSSDTHKALWHQFLKDHEGKMVRVELSKNPVSDELRGYYYGAVLPTAKSAVPQWHFLSADDVHEILKKQFNYFEAYNPGTDRIERFGRSAMGQDSNSVRAMEYIDKITEWLGTEYMIEVPRPDEYKQLRDSAQMK